MAIWTDYWRIIKPSPVKANYAPATVEDNGQGSYSNWSWYSQIIKTSASRLAKYQQFDGMDADVDMARALDTIAEEMSGKDPKTDLPFKISYKNEDNKEVDETIVTTLKAALRHWCELQDLDNRVFGVSRNTIKYGDCFFRKTSDFRTWKYVNASDVIGIELDEHEKVKSYHLRSLSQKNLSGGQEVEVVPAAAMVHFSLSNNMTNDGPFGTGVLAAIVKAYKQLSMLEDAIIIYRIVRAPERRVFFVDTGNMPPHKVKQYLESVKNEIRQRRIPSQNGGQENVDGVYNPTSMLEDYIFSVSTNGRGSRVETLPGGENLGEITDLNYFQEKVFRGLRIPNSYMRGSDKGGAQSNDGKVGIAYIEELRFANFVNRLQNKIERVFDAQFKVFLKAAKINIDPNLFFIKLPEPSNYEVLKQAAVDAELINTFNSTENIDYMSKRFALKRYLGWTEEDIQLNEALLRQERNIPEGGYGDELTDLRMIYDPKWKDDRPNIAVPANFETTGDGAEGGGTEEEAPPEEKEPEDIPDLGASDEEPPEVGASDEPDEAQADENSPPAL